MPFTTSRRSHHRSSYLAGLQVGIATTAAVILHEIPHEAGNFFLLLYAGFSKRRALLLNCLSGLVATCGTLVSLYVGLKAKEFALGVVPMAAGGLIYIAGSACSPTRSRSELQTFHQSVRCSDRRHRHYRCPETF